MKSLKILLAVLVLGWASSAFAEPDSFFLGDGHLGSGSVIDTNVVLNRYAKVTGTGVLSPGDDYISISNTVVPRGNFAAGELILVLQTTGTALTGDSINLDSIEGGKVGRWEFARIKSVSNNNQTLTLTEPLVNSYDKERTQVIYVPEYASLHIKSNASVIATYWNEDEGTGGVIAFLVRNSLVNEGRISADGAGFTAASSDGSALTCIVGVGGYRGKGLNASLTSNETTTAGGGGPCMYGGGGGGGRTGKGGKGGRPSSTNHEGGSGGAKVTHESYPGRLILGGGGGAGHAGGSLGGNGGGAILIRAGSMLGAGKITANGFDGSVTNLGGAGGGGAGGTIILRFTDKIQCPDALSVKGGKGGDSSKSSAGAGGGGGGGGGGLIVLQSPNDCSSSFDYVGGEKGVSGAASVVADDGEPGDIFPDPNAMVQPGPVILKFITPQQAGFVTFTRPIVTVEAPSIEDEPTFPLYNRNVYLDFDKGPRTKPLLLLTPTTPEWTPYSGKPPGVPDVGSDVILDQNDNTVKAIAEYKGLWSKQSSFGFKVDTIGPSAPIIVGPDPVVTGSRTVRFAFSSPDGGVAFKCAFDTFNGWIPCDKDVVFDADKIPTMAVPSGTLAEGKHTLKVRALDIAGNLGPEKTYEWVFDWTPPGKPTVIAPAPNSFVSSATYTIKATATTANSLSVYLDDKPGKSAIGDGKGGWSYTPSSGEVGDGLHRVRVVAMDGVGNQSDFSDTILFTVDTIVPVVEIKYPADITDVGSTPISDKPLVVRGTAEAGSTVTVTVSKVTGGSRETISTAPVPTGVVGAPGDWRYVVPEPPDTDLGGGTYEVTASARDSANHTTSTPDKIQFILDRQPPDTTLTCPDAFTNDATVSFSFRSDDTDATYECVLGNDFTTKPITCPSVLSKSSKPYSDGEGPYTILARAKDKAGNVDPTPSACTWTWDTTPPGKVVIDRHPDPVTNSTIAVFVFNKNDDLGKPVDVFKCSLDGAEFSTCPNPHALFLVKDGVALEGSHTLRVIAEDRAGNRTQSGREASYTWSIITKLPIAKITPREGTNNPTNVTSAAFEFGLETPIDGVKYRYILNDLTTDDTGAFTELPTGNKLTIQATVKEGEEKTYTLKVLAHDTEHNLYTPPEQRAVYSWKIDRKSPLIEIVGKPATWERFATASFEFSAPGEERVSGFRCAINNCLSTPTSADTEDCSGSEVGLPRITYKVEGGLGEGRNCISVWTRDRAGNLSSEPGTYEWNVDTQKPEPPVIDANQGELTVDTRFPLVDGNAEPFSEVSLFVVDGAPKLVATVGADEKGRWRAQITQELSDGTHGIQASAKDRAGNEGLLSEKVKILVDSQSPARVIGGGVGCAASGNGSIWLALLGLTQVLFRSRRRRRE